MAWLEDHPPKRSQFRRPRRDALSGVIVVHTAENTPDHVAFDGGAEAVARFIRDRSDAGSYHDLVDSDSAINLVRYDDEAYHDGTGSNLHSLGLSIATRADVWPLAPQAWRDGAIEQAARAAARMAGHVKARTGIVVPARRIDRAASELRQPGFISHAERDPTRRTDPGRAFPWDQFLARFAQLTAPQPAPAPTPEDEAMFILHIENSPYTFLFNPADRSVKALTEEQFWDYAVAGLRVSSLPNARFVRVLDTFQHPEKLKAYPAA